MTFAWPCLLAKNCVDPATKYNGHLLLSHIIAKFAIHKRIVLQVFHSLLKAHAMEARTVVKQALDILTPAMPGRMEDGNVSITSLSFTLSAFSACRSCVTRRRVLSVMLAGFQC